MLSPELSVLLFKWQRRFFGVSPGKAQHGVLQGLALLFKGGRDSFF
jgi:hypothetical protein